ncbi:GNAT family N-acetyltransferase [Maribacter hydrothermalis]|uniref:GNAT family acetyltransferase n=1 Tax=Maribacter hydrothermalis TaxID=1836467 RepID=A0A1B7ZEP0_9FLAO|nr:GNAT family N-acetyltransferase [Maribacter hydrothermalis]APQ17423.1 GNAT family N-acetyltransferase [Maribacter hydrothermalis]OBR41902.1 GNAT family acetyltransferase [Maribacter hydrothermalis]
MELSFKLCSLSELAQLREISEQTFVTAFAKDNDPTDFKRYIEHAFALEKIKGELSNPNSDFYFVYANDEVVGYFKLNVQEAQSELKYDDSIELERIYVLQKHQGLGLGVQFLNHIKKLSQGRKKNMLWLGVWQENKRAIEFYERNGFQKFDTHPYFIGSDKQTDWLMRFDLSTL